MPNFLFPVCQGNVINIGLISTNAGLKMCDSITSSSFLTSSFFHADFGQVNITILDINDNAPVWRDEPYHANVVEMSPINTDVISVSTSSKHKTTHLP